MQSLWVRSLVVVGMAACAPKGAALCGPNMRYDASLFVCLCDDQSIQVTGGCDRCAEDEVPSGGTCACPPGEAKDAGGVCATVPGLGDACDVARPCTDAVYDTCNDGTCTRTCATDTDCPDSYTCTDWEATPSCRVFTGVGASCAGPGDCAGFDADTCGQGHCTVGGCAVGVDDCPRDLVCCDFSVYGGSTACAAPAVCP